MKKFVSLLTVSFVLAGSMAACSNTNNVVSATASAPSQLPSAAEVQQSAFHWVKQPHLGYAQMLDIENFMPHLSVPAIDNYLNVEQGGLWGMIDFDGNTIFPLAKGTPVAVCGDAHAHAGPEEYNGLTLADGEAFVEEVNQAGFPVPIGYGGHGGSRSSQLVMHPNTGECMILYISDGPGMVGDTALPEYGLEEVKKNNGLIIYSIAPEGTATDFSDYYDKLQQDSNYRTNAKYGLMLYDTKEQITPAVYDDIEDCTNGFYALRQGDKWGYFNASTRQLITECIYDGMVDEPYQSFSYFCSGYRPVAKDGLYGFIDETGAEVIAPQFEGATHVFESKAWVKQNGLWGQIEIMT